jgi:hypothetical protein
LVHSTTSSPFPRSDDRDFLSRRPLRVAGHMAPCSTPCWQPTCLSVDAGGVGVTALTMQAHACDDVPGLSLRHETPLSACPGGSLELRPAVALEDRVFALVALLVALVRHRRSYSVRLGNRTALFQLARQMREFLRWRATERD